MVLTVIVTAVVVLVLYGMAVLRRRSNRIWVGSRAGGIQRPSAVRRAQEAARIRQGLAARQYLASDFAASDDAQEPNRRSLGLVLAPIAEDVPALRVVSIEPGSAAARVGVKEGDELLAVNGVEVRKPDTVTEIIRKQPSGRAVYLVWRAGNREQQASVIL